MGFITLRPGTIVQYGPTGSIYVCIKSDLINITYIRARNISHWGDSVSCTVWLNIRSNDEYWAILPSPRQTGQDEQQDT